MSPSVQFKTIVNRFEATCKRCKETVPPGVKVRWGKGRGVWHFADVCPASRDNEE